MRQVLSRKMKETCVYQFLNFRAIMFDKSQAYGDFGRTPSERSNSPTSSTALPGSGQRGCLGSFALGCGATTALLLCCGGALALIWPGFVRFGIDSDLANLERLVGTAEISNDERTALLERVAALRVTARDQRVEFVEWMSLSDQLDAIAEDERIAPEEVPALERELTRLEQDFARP